ncbi:transposase [Streptomyces canus]|uniref:IS110 family transposase n=1 Tax=Streptomyces canus TaxID=58343 RepID=UPI0037FF2888
MTSNDFTSIDVFCAVGKSTHHGAALLRDGRITFDKPLPNGEPQLRELFARLGRKGKVLVLVDQSASIGTLAVTVARTTLATDQLNSWANPWIWGRPAPPTRRLRRRYVYTV